jgi:hypothetical protein
MTVIKNLGRHIMDEYYVAHIREDIYMDDPNAQVTISSNK